MSDTATDPNTERVMPVSTDGRTGLGTATAPIHIVTDQVSFDAIIAGLAAADDDVDVNGQLITSVADPVSAQDADTLAARKAAIAGIRISEYILAPAPGATIHASMAGGAALNVSTAFTRMIPATNIRLSRDGAGDPTIYTVSGTRFGAVISETINSDGANDVEGVKIFDTVTAITSDVDPVAATVMKTGVILGTANKFTSIDYLGVGAAGANGVSETATANAGKDGFTPTTAPNGSKVMQVRYLLDNAL